ncbi:MAG TPA: hypothetical protein VHN18_16080, partial [Micromonosporaceae bacterium]|nr:hypothetical protein [Micromonosporaceae bacterium]
GTATLRDAVGRLEAEEIRVLEVGLRRPTLDDVFLALTGHMARDEPVAPGGSVHAEGVGRRVELDREGVR